MAYHIIWPPFLLSLTSVMYYLYLFWDVYERAIVRLEWLDEGNRLVMGHDNTLVCLRRV